MARVVVMTDVPAIVATGLGSVLRDRGITVSDQGVSPDPYVEVVRCSRRTGEGWARLREQTDPRRVGCVALLDEFDLESCYRAYQSGSAVVHFDSPPDIAADVVAARLKGDILAPAGIVAAGMGAPPDELLPSERMVLLEVARGKTLAQVSEAVNYSERHVRRLLRSVLVKAGTDDRAEALEFFASQLEPDAA